VCESEWVSEHVCVCAHARTHTHAHTHTRTHTHAHTSSNIVKRFFFCCSQSLHDRIVLKNRRIRRSKRQRNFPPFFWVQGGSIGFEAYEVKNKGGKLRCLLLCRFFLKKFCHEVIVKQKKEKRSTILLLTHHDIYIYMYRLRWEPADRRVWVGRCLPQILQGVAIVLLLCC